MYDTDTNTVGRSIELFGAQGNAGSIEICREDGMKILRVLSGANEGNVYVLDKGDITIGSSDECDICLREEGVEPFHAKVEVNRGNTPYISNLSENAKTYVNGLSLSRSERLNPGDRIRLGKVALRYEMGHGVGDSLEIEVSREESAPPQIQFTLSDSEISNLFVSTAEEDIESLRRAHSSLLAIYQINQVLGSTFDLDTLLSKMLEITLASVDGDRGSIYLLPTENRNEEVIVSCYHPDHPPKMSDSGGAAKKPFSRSITNYVLRTGQSVLTSDATEDNRFMLEESVMALQIRSAMCVPLKGRHDVLGVMHIDAGTRNVFTIESLRLLACIGDMAGKVIENAQLFAENLQKERLAAIGQAVASTAHTIKNILNSMNLGGELIDIGIKTNNMEDVKTGWKPFKVSLDLLADLTFNMLDFSTEKKPQLVLTDVNQIMKELANLMKQQAEESDIELRLDLDTSMPMIKVDPSGIRRALINLVSNAFEAFSSRTKKRKRVRLITRFKPDKGIVLLGVEDNGDGIPQEIASKMFDLFVSTKGNKGTGLGLVVTKKIVEEHRGKILYKTREGQGTRFTVILPYSSK
ncbi:MAG TPA: GAF domain-containing protein [Deltaproteobacteria bacterium]|nr:GAF domain-containing protein [Deltaproteobacteria bacterium]